MLDSTEFENEAGDFATKYAARRRGVDADELYEKIVDKFNHIARHDEATAVEILRYSTAESFAKDYGLLPQMTYERGMSL